MSHLPDIDIDMKNREDLLSKLQHINASMFNNDIERHISGVYFHNVPTDPITGLCSLDYKKAEELGHIKIDLLHNTIYKDITDREVLRVLADNEPDWTLLKNKDYVLKLTQINKHYDLLQRMVVTNIGQMAMFLAIIRPGKKHLIGKQWCDVEKEIWIKPCDNSYFFKKAHAYSYAKTIVVQLNLILLEQHNNTMVTMNV